MARIAIQDLRQSLTPSVEHLLASMKDGVTESLSVQQIIDLCISAIVGNSPEALNTLQELSNALGDDENFATNVLNSIAGKLSLDGSTPMTGALNMANNDIQNVSNLVGVIGYFPMATPFPGWLKANGAAISRTSYVNLFNVIGTTFGTGDGSTTFNLPDLRGEFIRGFDDSRGVDSGRVMGSSQSEDFKSHWHASALTGNFPAGASNTIPQHVFGSSGITGSSTGQDTEIVLSTASVAEGNEIHYRSSSTGGTETRPRNIALLACIKY